MNRFITAAIVAVLVAGCAAGQPFGPTARSGCQEEASASVSTKTNILASVTAVGVGDERKAALKTCNRQITAAIDACFASPSAAGAQAIKTQSAACDALVGGGS